MVCGDLNFFMTVKRTAVTEREGGREGGREGARERGSEQWLSS